MEDNGHDIPRRGELRWGNVTTKCPKEVPLVLRYAIVYFDIVISTAGMVLQLKVVKGEDDRGALGHYNQPEAVNVVGIKAWEVWARDVTRWSREDSSTFDT